MALLLRRRLRNTSTPILIRRAERLIQQIPDEERRKRLEEWLEKIREMPPGERLLRMIALLVFLFLLAGAAMAIGYAITPSGK